MATRKKTTSTVTCHKCKKVIKDRDFLKCSTCECHYDIACQSISTQRFYTMTRTHKEDWQCRLCLQPAEFETQPTRSSKTKLFTVEKNIAPMVTRSRQNKVLDVDTSLRNSDEENSILSSLEDTNLHSLPDLSTHYYEKEKEEEHVKEIEKLSMELTKAHLEVDRLNVENCQLKKQLKENEMSIKRFKRVLTEPVNSPKRRSSLKNAVEAQKIKALLQEN